MIYQKSLSPFSCTSPDQPFPPIVSMATTDSSITLTWNTIQYCFESEIFQFVVIWNEIVSGTSNNVTISFSPYTISGLQPGTSYEVSVYGVSGSGVVSEWRVLTATTTGMQLEFNSQKIFVCITHEKLYSRYIYMHADTINIVRYNIFLIIMLFNTGSSFHTNYSTYIHAMHCTPFIPCLVYKVISFNKFKTFWIFIAAKGQSTPRDIIKLLASLSALLFVGVILVGGAVVLAVLCCWKPSSRCRNSK